jgi:hypothetical protein
MLASLLELVEYLCVVSFHKLSLLPGLGRTLEYFMSCLAS